MAEPWFDPNTFGAWFGAIGGGVGGSLGGLWGALGGVLAPRGKGRAFILGFGWLMVVAGVVSLAFGLYALAVGQPYGIWYGPVLLGIIVTTVVGSLMPVVRLRYRQADERRLQAEDFRQE